MIAIYWKRAAALLAALATAGLTAAAPALADDGIALVDYHTDSMIEFNLGISGGVSTAATPGEAKAETSPLMIYPTVITFDKCRVYGEGSHSRYGAWTAGSTLTVEGYGVIYDGDEGKRLILRTNINEYGYEYARLTAWQCSDPGVLRGLWSPDSYEQPTDIVINCGHRY